MNFEQPIFLWLLAVVAPALGWFFWWAARRRARLAEQFVTARLLDQLTVGVSRRRQRVRAALALLAVALVFLALARPQWGFNWETAKQSGLDIIVAIDTSRSMLATDVAPNRLERAKLEALSLMGRAKTDRLGLIAFAGSAFLQCPLTLDGEAFRQSVQTLDTAIIPQGGTALAEAIRTATEAFEKSDGNHQALILFTDGEDHAPDAHAAARAAAEAGIRIFTVGLGTVDGELLRVRDEQGVESFVKDDDGNVVKSRLNESLLQGIATTGKGFYLNLRGADTIDVLYDRGLAPLPKRDYNAKLVKRLHEKFYWPLGIAVLLLVIEVLLPERARSGASGNRGPGESRNPPLAPPKEGNGALTRHAPAQTLAFSLARSHSPPGRGWGWVRNLIGTRDVPMGATRSVVSAAARLAMWLLILAAGGLATAHASESTAQKAYANGRYDSSFKEFHSLAKRRSDDARLNYNAGVAAHQAGDFDAAAMHLQRATGSKDPALQQQAFYNLGNTRYRQGEQAADNPEQQIARWEEALKHFDAAKQMNPQDADAAFNYDFVKKKLEELKQQQQQKQEQQQSKSDQEQKKDDQQKGQKSAQQDQKQDQPPSSQEKKDQSSQQQQSPQDGKSEPKDSEQQRQQEEQKKREEQQKQQQAQNESQGGKADGEQSQGAQASAVPVTMTPQQAQQMLEAHRGEEQVLLFQPPPPTNAPARRLKDW
jgi:Ca-activated chloride channel family protein